MTPEPAQPAESPEAKALPQPSAAATAIALTAKPGDFPTDSYSLAMWLDRTMLAATTARPTERGAVEDGDGWVSWNPDVGEEYTPNHPIDSGECVEAEHVRRSTPQEDVLWKALQEQFMRAEALSAAALTPPVTVAATDQAAEVECREALGALVTAAAEYQEAAQQHISDTRYDEDGNLAARDAELSVVALPRARATLATQPATGGTMGGEEAASDTLAALNAWAAKTGADNDDDYIAKDDVVRYIAALQNGGER